MPNKTRTVSQSSNAQTVLSETGETLRPPADWTLLPPGDAAHTRAVKEAGPYWQIRIKKGRRIFSGGIWAPASTIQNTGKRLEKNLDQKQSS